MTEKEVVVSMIWDELVKNSKTNVPTTAEEKEMLMVDIEYKLMRGWTPHEIMKYFHWTEYFNTEDSEEYCIERLNSIEKRMAARLGR